MILANTPLADRISRWVDTGRATKILLHPRDFHVLQSREGLIDKVEKQYGLPVVCLGGEEGLKKFIKDNMRSNKDEEDS